MKFGHNPLAILVDSARNSDEDIVKFFSKILKKRNNSLIVKNEFGQKLNSFFGSKNILNDTKNVLLVAHAQKTSSPSEKRFIHDKKESILFPDWFGFYDISLKRSAVFLVCYGSDVLGSIFGWASYFTRIICFKNNIPFFDDTMITRLGIKKIFKIVSDETSNLDNQSKNILINRFKRQMFQEKCYKNIFFFQEERLLTQLTLQALIDEIEEIEY